MASSKFWNTLEINDRKQTIQGVYIEDKDTYYAIRTTVEVEHLEGWNPTKKDIEYLLNSANNPDPQLDKDYNEIFSDDEDKN